MHAAPYIYKGIYLYAVLYFLYAVVCIYGYNEWKKLMLAETK